MLLLAAAFSASAAESNASKLMVQGEGKISATGAAAENARLMDDTINTLLGAKIAKKDQALAIKDVKRKAEVAAAAADVKLGKVLEITASVTVTYEVS